MSCLLRFRLAVLAADPVQLASGVAQWFVSCSVYMSDATFIATRGQVAHAPMVPGSPLPQQASHVKSVVSDRWEFIAGFAAKKSHFRLAVSGEEMRQKTTCAGPRWWK